MIFNFKIKKGFTIIELVISIFILSVAVVGIFSAFSVTVILTSGTADQLTATYLAQEGMELVRNIRDTNWLNVDTCTGTPCTFSWVDGLTKTGLNNGIDCSSSTSGCQADYSNTYLSPWGGVGTYLNTDNNGFYSYSTTGTVASTKFKRKIIINPITDVDGKDDHIVKVTVEVSWDEKANILYPGADAKSCGLYNCVTVEGTLYDWYDYTAP